MDDILNQLDETNDGQPKDLVTKLINELSQSVKLFCDANEIGYAQITINGVTQLWKLRSKNFSRFLSKTALDNHKRGLNKNLREDVLCTLEAKAKFEGQQLKTYLRAGEDDENILLDMCCDEWKMVSCNANGWETLSQTEPKLARSSGMLSLPTPSHNGDFDLLWEFLNVRKDVDRKLIMTWLLTALMPGISYPLIVFNGEQGAAKSTSSTILRNIIDPHDSPLRTLPSKEKDLYIAAFNNWILAFDNMSGLTPAMSDALCKISTGGAYSARTLYADDEETILKACNPMILNGITDFVTRQDLVDRAYVIQLAPITKRKSEAKLWTEFRQAHPIILGGLLDLLSGVLQHMPHINEDDYDLPRMSDFGRIGIALEKHLNWTDGTFMAAHNANKLDAIINGLDSEPVATALLSLMENRTYYEDTPENLLNELRQRVSEETIRKSTKWPNAAHVLTGRLKRLSPALRTVGLDVLTGDAAGRTAYNRKVIISKTDQPSVTSVSASSNDACDTNDANIERF